MCARCWANPLPVGDSDVLGSGSGASAGRPPLGSGPSANAGHDRAVVADEDRQLDFLAKPHRD